MAIGTRAMSDAIDSKKISRRSIVAGIAALGVYGFARNARAAETRPLAERLGAYAAALRYEDLDAATIECVKSHVIDTLGCGIAALVSGSRKHLVDSIRDTSCPACTQN